LQVNKNGLKPAHVIDRIRWIYQRLTTYEQHLTMRQIIAHLAFSITGGINCEVAHKHVLSASTKDSHGLGEILFSESFFGYRRGEIHPQAAQLRAIGLIQRLEFGSPFSADFEKKLTSLNTNDWIKLPPDLSAIWSSWQNLACGTSGVRFRFALRRVTYLYGYSQTNMNFAGFMNHFLMAPRLCDFDRWQIEKMMTLSHIEMHNFKITILKVLLGIYSGFNAGQFKDDEQKLYLTLRRADKTVVQTTQLVTASFDYDDFSLEYNKATGTPYLIYSKNMAYLQLSLPLLDYIQLTSEGCLGNQLTPIHVAQLERFRSSLIKIKGQKIKNNEEIKLLRAGIDGAVKIHRYVLDNDRNELIQF